MSDSQQFVPQLRRLFTEVIKLQNSDEQRSFIDAACGEDTVLRAELENLLKNYGIAASPLGKAIEQLNPVTQALVGSATADLLTISASPPRPTEDGPGEFWIGNYKILEHLGDGGMGTVYKARQITPVNREVAIKLVKAGHDSREVLRRFQFEKTALERMSHPNITSILDAGITDQGRPFLVIELAKGVAIDTYCRENRLDTCARIQLMIEVCRAVEHAHIKGIIHRDIKPANVLVLSDDNRHVPKIIDFGIAKLVQRDVDNSTQFTRFDQLIGTPQYMSPEQSRLDQNAIDTRTDIYSLGMLLYALLVGEPSIQKHRFRRLSPAEMQILICDHLPERPSDRISAIRRKRQADSKHIAQEARHNAPPDILAMQSRLKSELDWVVLKAIDGDPNRRYKTTGAFADDLENFLAERPVSAHAPSILYKSRKFAARHVISIAFAAIVLLTGGIGGFIAVRNGWRAVQAEAKVRASEQRALELLKAERQRSAELASVRASEKNTLEYLTLEKKLEAFRDRDLVRMATYQLPTDDQGRFLGTPDSNFATQKRQREPDDSASFRQMLLDIANPQPKSTIQHPKPVFDLSLSPDQTKLATTCADGWLRIWQIEGLDNHENPLKKDALLKLGPHFGLTKVAFGPFGRLVATGDKDGVVRIWDIESGKSNFESDEDNTGVESLAWSPNGETLAIGFRNGPVVFVDRDGQPIREVDRELRHHVRNESVLFTNDSTRAITAHDTVGVQVWKYRDLESGPKTFKRNFYPRQMCWLDEDQNLLLALTGRHGLLTHISKGWQTEEIFGRLGAKSLACDMTRQIVAIGYPDGTAGVFRYQTGPDLSTTGFKRLFQFRIHPSSDDDVQPIVFTKDGQLVTGGSDGLVKFWDIDQVEPVHTSSVKGVWCFELLSDGSALCLIPDRENPTARIVRHIVGSDQPPQTIGTTSFHPPTALPGISRDSRTPIEAFAVNEDGNLIAAADKAAIEIRNLDDGSLLQRIAVNEEIRQLEFDKSGRKIWAVSANRQQIIWRSDDHWRSTHVIRQWRDLNAESSFADAGDTIVQRQRNEVTENDAETGELIRRWDDAGYLRTWISPDSQLIAFASISSLGLYDRKTNNPLLKQSVSSELLELDFVDDNRFLLTLEAGERLRIWHVPTQQSITIDSLQDIAHGAQTRQPQTRQATLDPGTLEPPAVSSAAFPIRRLRYCVGPHSKIIAGIRAVDWLNGETMFTAIGRVRQGGSD